MFYGHKLYLIRPKFSKFGDNQIFFKNSKFYFDKNLEILKHRGMGSVRRSKAMFENAQVEAKMDKPSTPIQTRRMRSGFKRYKLYRIRS